MIKSSKRFLSTPVSKEYIEYIVVEEASKLINRRCKDLGYIPFQQSNIIKLFGRPLLERAPRKPATLIEMSENTKLEDMKVTNYFLPVLVKNSMVAISEMEKELGN